MGLFKKAVQSDAKLRLAIAGPSGSGKTWTALAIATALAPGKVALVDTEHGSASKYARDFSFDVAEMHAPYKVEKFIQVIREAADAGYQVIILDSLSHAWNGPGGVLEEVDKAAKKSGGNSYYAWREGTPLQQSLIDGIVSAPIHVIATMRSKEDYAETTENGKKTYRKVGTAPIQRDGMSYEFDVVFDMNLDHDAVVTKSRCSALADEVIKRPGADVAKTLSIWLSGEPLPAPKRPKLTNDQEETLMALGRTFYGDNWGKQQVKLAESASTGVVNRIADLMPKEAELLIKGLQKRISEAEQQAQQPTQEPA